jgi:hypothetical protein
MTVTWYDDKLLDLWDERSGYPSIEFRGRPADVLLYIRLIENALEIGHRWPVGEFFQVHIWLMEHWVLAACWWRNRTATIIEVTEVGDS